MISLTRVLLSLCLFVAGLIAIGVPFPNEDLFLAFCSGRDVLSGNLAAPDKWSFTMHGKVWIDQSWLSHLIYYYSFLNLAYLGPVLLKVILLAASLELLYLRCRSLSISPGVSLIALTLGTLAFAPFLKIRAENFGMLYFIILSNLLTFPNFPNRWRQIGSVLTLGVWSNAHGSFMLGFVLVGVRCLIEIFNRFKVWNILIASPWIDPKKGLSITDVYKNKYLNRGISSINKKKLLQNDIWGWLATVFLALFIISFANPYGTDNLIVPFQQLFTQETTVKWVDWLPLLHWETLSTKGWFNPLSVRPFLVLLGIVGLFMIILVRGEGFRKISICIFEKTNNSIGIMEVSILLILMPLVFKFQRLITFAAPALIPILAILIQRWIEHAKIKVSWMVRVTKSRFNMAVFATLTCLCLFFLGVICFKSVGVRYLPSNPLNYERKALPVVQRLMSHDLMRKNAVQFMKKNNIHGRIFTNIFLSNYLLYHIPEIKLFFDLRAHSFFSDKIIKDYLLIDSSNSTEFAQGQKLMQQFDVSFVVLDTTTGYYSKLADRLMKTKQWACIYRDDRIIILASVLSKGSAHLTADGGLDRLWYGKSSTKVVSKSLLSFFMKGLIQPELLNSLIKIQRSTPKHYVYRLIVRAMNGDSNCLNEPTKDFLESEALRLSASNYMVSGGAYSILLSLFQVLVILENNDKLCEPQKADYKYSKWKREVTAVLKQIKTRYGGF